MLTDIEKQIIASIQGDIPVCRQPYAVLAERIGISEADFLHHLAELNARGLIRRFGATLRHQRSGFRANAMVAWQVPESRIETIGPLMAGFSAVSHCYRRDPKPTWPYNLYTMVHAADMEECRSTVAEMAKTSGIDRYEILLSKRELKKTSMAYFEDVLPDE